MKKKHKSLLVLLSLLMLAFLFFPARSEAQVNSGSSRVSYSFAEKSSVSDEHLRQLKEGFPKEIAQADEERFILVYQKQKQAVPPAGTTTVSTEAPQLILTSSTTSVAGKILPKTGDGQPHLIFMLLGLASLTLLGVFLWKHSRSTSTWLILLLAGLGLLSYQSSRIRAESLDLKSSVVRFVPKGQAMTYVPEAIEGYDYIGYIYLLPSLDEPNPTTSLESTTSQLTSETTSVAEPTTTSTVEESQTSSATTESEPSTVLTTTGTTIWEPTTSSRTTTVAELTTSSRTTTSVEPTTSSRTTTVADPTTTSTTTVAEPTTSSTTTTVAEPTTSSATTTVAEPTTSSTTTTVAEPTTSSRTTTVAELTTSSTTTTVAEPTTSSRTTTVAELTTSSTTTTVAEPTTSSRTTASTTTTVATTSTTTTSTTTTVTTTSTTTTTTEEPVAQEQKGKVIVSYYAYKWVNGEVSPPYDGIDIDGYSTDPDYAFPQIAPSDILEGNIGENYKTEPKEIPGYQRENYTYYNESGVFAEETKEVRYYYGTEDGSRPKEGFVKLNFVLEDGSQFALPRYKSGIEGLSYEVEIPDLDNYEFVKIEGERNGVYRSDETPELTLTYRDIRDTEITILHLTDQWEELDRQVIKGVAGKKYSLDRIYPVYHRFYEFAEIEGEREGVFQEEPFTIVYRYRYRYPEGRIPINYKLEDGSSLRDSRLDGAPSEISGAFGTTYKLEPYNGGRYYELSRVEGSLEGTFLPVPNEITLYYKERPQARVTANYYTEDGQFITSKVFEGGNGLPYQVETRLPHSSYFRYNFVRSEGDLSGIYSSEVPQTISLYYREKDESSVHMKYVERETGEELGSNVMYGFVGESYQTYGLYDPNMYYELVETSGAPETGVYTSDVQTITYYYQRIKHKITVIHKSTDYFFTRDLSYSEIIEGKLGEPYSISPVDNIEYVVGRVENGTLSGEMTYGEKIIYVHYVPNPNRSSITFEFLNTMYTPFAPSLTVRGTVGETYTGPIREFADMIYDGSDSVDENGQDLFVFKPHHQTINLFYEYKGRVIVKHVYRNHPEYNTELVLEGKSDYPYTTSPLPREGTVQAEVDGSEQGYFPVPWDGPITVTYYYD